MQASRLASSDPLGAAQGGCDATHASPPSVGSAHTRLSDTVRPQMSTLAAVRRVRPPLLRRIATELGRVAGRALRLALLTVALLEAPATAAAPLEEAIAAYEAGDYGRAIPLLEEAAEGGHASALYWLGHAHDYGHGVPTDPDRALELYWEAAELGLPEAQATIAYSFDEGIGVPLDDAEAIRWYRKAAQGGDVPSQRALGLMYAEGEGVEKDFAEAERWFRRAAEAGDPVAQTELGHQLWMGYGVTPEPRRREALEWTSRAAQRDYAKAQYLLCAYYRKLFRQGDDRLVEAFKWCKLAADQDYPGGRQGWEAASRWYISEEQKAEAARRAAEWAALHRAPQE